MRTALICHEGAVLPLQGMTRWLASFSDLVAIVVIDERPERRKGRIRREIARVGWWRFLDVLAFRVYARFALAPGDERYRRRQIETLRREYPTDPPAVPVHETHSPNTKATRAFLREHRPDVAIALCKNILFKSVFSIPTHGTYVFHPGVCPEYRNAHGCFWALAHDDLERVGMTLLRIDEGIDTGPVLGYFSYDFDEIRESHNVIQNRVVYENLPRIRAVLEDVVDGRAAPIDVSGRESREWGQPWLSKYAYWKRQARKRARRRPAR